VLFITEENYCIGCYICLYNTARLWCPLYTTTPSYFWPWARSVRKRISDLFFWDKDTRRSTLHYCDTMHCINAIILIMIVILSLLREAHYPDLPPFAYILLAYFSLHYTLLIFLNDTFHSEIFQPPSPVGRAGEASRPKFTNFTYTPNLTFPEEKAWKPGMMWSWQVEFWLFPLTCFVAFKTLSHYRASVWYVSMFCINWDNNPLTDRNKILHAGCRPWRNHACQFLWRSVKGFRRGDGSNFGFFHWLASSPLKHYRTTVPGQEMRFQVPPKTFRLDGLITQRIRQWVPNRHTGDWESPGVKSAAMKPRNIQFSTSGRTEIGSRKLRRLVRSCQRGTSEAPE